MPHVIFKQARKVGSKFHAKSPKPVHLTDEEFAHWHVQADLKAGHIVAHDATSGDAKADAAKRRAALKAEADAKIKSDEELKADAEAKAAEEAELMAKLEAEEKEKAEAKAAKAAAKLKKAS